MRVLKPLVGLLLGGMVAALGTVAHRGHQPWGILVAIACVLTGAMTVRAWAGRLLGTLPYGLAVVAVVLELSRTGPGGSVLMPAGSTIGTVWLWSAPAAVLLAALAPGLLFADARRVRTGPEAASAPSDAPSTADPVAGVPSGAAPADPEPAPSPDRPAPEPPDGR